MISKSFYIDVYSYELMIVVSRKDQDNIEELKKELTRLSLPDNFISDTLKNFDNGGWGGQYIISGSTRSACIEVHNCDKAWKVADVLTHEMDHVRGFIVKNHELEGAEASAYLAGFLGRKLLPLILRMK